MAVKKTDSVLEDLAAPFSKDQKKSYKEGKQTFTTVAWTHYLSRLMEAVPGLYSVRTGSPILIKTANAQAVAVASAVDIEIDGNIRSFGGVGAVGVDKSSDEDKELANVIKSAAADSFKRSLVFAGVNFDVYDGADTDTADEDEDEAPAPKKKPKPAPGEDEDEDDEPAPKKKPKPAPVEDEDEDDEPAPKRKPASSSDDYDGSEKVGFGAHKEEAWEELDGSYLQYGLDNWDEGKNLTNVKREIKRRKAEGTFDPKQGQKKAFGGARRSSGRSNKDDF